MCNKFWYAVSIEMQEEYNMEVTNRAAGLSIREEMINIPTYGVGPMDKNPMFFEKRVYQGSSGKVYPLPVIDKIYDDNLSNFRKMIVRKRPARCSACRFWKSNFLIKKSSA